MLVSRISVIPIVLSLAVGVLMLGAAVAASLSWPRPLSPELVHASEDHGAP